MHRFRLFGLSVLCLVSIAAPTYANPAMDVYNALTPAQKQYFHQLKASIENKSLFAQSCDAMFATLKHGLVIDMSLYKTQDDNVFNHSSAFFYLETAYWIPLLYIHKQKLLNAMAYCSLQKTNSNARALVITDI